MIHRIIGNPTKDIVVYTNVYDTPNGNLQGTVAWTQDPSKSFKELKQGTAIAWGSNTDALESAQCMGVYLKVDDALADVKKLGVATAKTNWNPQIKSVLSNGQDWDSGGVSKLVSKIDNMPDANWLEMLFLAKGMKNFIDKEGKNIGSTYHIIHGSIKKYYEDFHKVSITEEAIDTAIKLSVKYQTDKKLPDKAIDLLDVACSRFNITS